MENAAAFVLENRKMEVRPTAMPVCGEDEVLVEMGYVGICGSDLHFYSIGEPEFPDVYPFSPGHELAGEIVEVGRKVTDLKVGDRVALEPGIPCRRCEWCKEGRYHLCSDVKFLSYPRTQGGLRKYVAHPADLCFKLPEGLSTLEGALVEPLAVGLFATKGCGIQIGKKAAIIGAGAIGLVTFLSLRAMGVEEIAVVDVFENRLEKAKELGATYVFNGSKSDIVREVKESFAGLGPDYVFECAGNIKTASQTIYMVKRGGTVLIVGNVVGQTPIDFQLCVNKNLTIRTTYRYCNVFATAVEAIASGRINVKQIVSNEFEFKDSMHAFETSLTQKQSLIKGVIKVAGSSL
ncbi:MAG: alcohol dehydrogenase [Acidobacteria bacterium]|nr:MAG: alcohol dehydrogenase [Acidobacteriota bacterium]